METRHAHVQQVGTYIKLMYLHTHIHVQTHTIPIVPILGRVGDISFNN